MAGFVYIMSNPAFPDRIKIGKSSKDPTTDRVNELNQTGVPEPYQVEYYAFVEDADYLERAVHKHFSEFRPNKNREFFHVTCAEAIGAIRELSEPNAKIKLEEVFYVSEEELETIRKQKEQEERQAVEDMIKRALEKAKLEREEEERLERERKEAADALKRQRDNLISEIETEIVARKAFAWKAILFVPLLHTLMAIIICHLMKVDLFSRETFTGLILIYAFSSIVTAICGYPTRATNKIETLNLEQLTNAWNAHLAKKETALFDAAKQVLQYFVPLALVFSAIGALADGGNILLALSVGFGALTPYAVAIFPFVLIKKFDLQLTPEKKT